MTTDYQTVILDSGGFVWALLPVSSVIFIFWFLSKKRNKQNNISNQKKDELWYIVKGHLKKEGKTGYEITDLTLYPRPELKDLNGYIFRSEVSKAKQKAELEGRKYQKPIRQKKYEIEKIFHTQEQEREAKSLSKNKNKIYVVCYRLKERDGADINDWECIEVELYKENINDQNYSVKSKNLDYQFESYWIFDMQNQYLSEKYLESKRKLESFQKQEKWKKIKGDFVKFFPQIPKLPQIPSIKLFPNIFASKPNNSEDLLHSSDIDINPELHVDESKTNLLEQMELTEESELTDAISEQDKTTLEENIPEKLSEPLIDAQHKELVDFVEDETLVRENFDNESSEHP